ncbi:hypothetical protein SKAU_G00189380 [Synaphobranchus kaupii]|uniref:Uncharacterized protein n=1 Tax=Synaphobranchus kaupii TaxID=118154 RepID=A0A9Q1FDC9_SYNKA|nr:hypothetical protein SKAU_G00189380 [Synaphobranchus kaupii]
MYSTTYGKVGGEQGGEAMSGSGPDSPCPRGASAESASRRRRKRAAERRFESHRKYRAPQSAERGYARAFASGGASPERERSDLAV